MGRVDVGLKLTQDPKVILTAFGDMVRVPRRMSTPLEMKAKGAEIRLVYSPLDVLKLALKPPGARWYFLPLGSRPPRPLPPSH